MEGLVKFREAFAEYSENYVVIGGAACDITMTNTVVRPPVYGDRHGIGVRLHTAERCSRQRRQREHADWCGKEQDAVGTERQAECLQQEAASSLSVYTILHHDRCVERRDGRDDRPKQWRDSHPSP